MNLLSEIQTFYSRGKLLLTGEYVVLDGALALAVPTQLGQKMWIKKHKDFQSTLRWKSIDVEKNIWFEAEYLLPHLIAKNYSNPSISEQLVAILQEIQRQNSAIFSPDESLEIVTELEFPTNFGLGSSSTLIANLADWSKTSPYVILEKTLGGSGYDVACAKAKSALLYQKVDSHNHVTPVTLSENITEHLAFVYLNQKQNSREGIKAYKSKNKDEELIEKITKITFGILECTSWSVLKNYIEEHEELLADFLNIPTAKELHFPDYSGFVKSLGAWGGDFVLVSKLPNYKSYFQEKGFHTIFDYSELIYH